MKKLLIALFAVAAFSGATFLCAADEPAKENKTVKKEECKKDKACKDAKKAPKRFNHIAVLKEKNPQEMAKADALLKESKAKYEEAMNLIDALAAKEGIQTPRMKMKAHKEKWNAFKQKCEKELKEIKELRKTDPAAAQQKMTDLMKREGFEVPAIPAPKMTKKPVCPHCGKELSKKADKKADKEVKAEADKKADKKADKDDKKADKKADKDGKKDKKDDKDDDDDDKDDDDKD